MTAAREILNRNIPEYLKASALARKLAPSGIHDAAYFGSGPDAETFLHVTNADHGWMFDAIPLESDRDNYQKTWRPFKESFLWNQLGAGIIEEHVNGEWGGDFSPEMHHAGQLGRFLVGNLKLIGATNISLEEISRYRTDIRFNWKHPDDATEKPRTLSFVWTPILEDSNWRTKTDALGALDEPLPGFDFAMTRAYNGPPLGDVPAFNRIVNHVRPGGVLFLDVELKSPSPSDEPSPMGSVRPEKALPGDCAQSGGVEQLAPSIGELQQIDWPHGGFHLYTKKFPARSFENQAA